jgi:uncharacterized membrane protein YphA (DoxX/SURF4 family)
MNTTATDLKLKRWVALLRISIGIIYIWFGMLKYFPGVSPAEDLAKETIHLLTFGLIGPDLSLLLLAVWETVIGVFLIAGLFKRISFWLVLVHMICTFTPLVLLPQLSFTQMPFSLTLVGQYIIKNIVIICALCVVNTFDEK